MSQHQAILSTQDSLLFLPLLTPQAPEGLQSPAWWEPRRKERRDLGEGEGQGEGRKAIHKASAVSS